MIVQNQEQRDEDDEEDEEVLDDLSETRPKEKLQGSGSKKNSRNTSKEKPATSSATGGAIKPQQALTQDNFDEFFNQMVSSATVQQQKSPVLPSSKTTGGVNLPANSNSTSTGQTATKKQKLPPKVPANNSTNIQDTSKVHKQSPPTNRQSFEQEELEERIRAYQGILQENEGTIEKFRLRVKELEGQLGQLQRESQRPADSREAHDLEAQHAQEVRALLEALDQERVKGLGYQSQIRELQTQNQLQHESSLKIKLDYNSKIQDIEKLLEGIVQQQLDITMPSAKGKKGGTNELQLLVNNQRKASLDQLLAQFEEIKALLKPSVAVADDQAEMNETIDKLYQNNSLLKTINLTLSDRMLALEVNYQDKLNQRLRTIDTERALWLNEQETKLSQQQLLFESQLAQMKKDTQREAELDKQGRQRAENNLVDTLKKIEEENKQETDKLLSQLKTESEKNKTEIEKAKADLEKAKEEVKQSKTEVKQAKADIDKSKRDMQDFVQQKLQVCLFQTFNLDTKLVGASVEDILAQFSAVIKENFKAQQAGQTLDEQNLKALKDIWEQAGERLKQLNLSRFAKQSQKDAQQWVTSRLPAGQMTGPKKNQAFKDTELAKFFGQQLELVFSVHAFILDLQIQLTEQTQKRESVSLQLTKLQKDLKDAIEREKDLHKVKDQSENLSNEHKSLKQQLQEVLSDKISFKLKLEEQREKLEMLVVENANLKDKVGEQENEEKRLRKQVKQQQAQMDLREDYKVQAEKLTQELKWAEQQLKSKESEQEEQRKTVQNLQRAVQHHQDEYEQLVRLKERESLEDKQLISTLQLQADQFKERVRETIALQERVTGLETENEQIQVQLEKAELERKEVSKYAHELLEKFKKEQEQQEYQVDRRIINKFLVNYMSQQSSKELKAQMLEAMSKILAFSIEEKQVLGLVRKQSLDETEAEVNNKGLGERLINFFLLDEDDD